MSGPKAMKAVQVALRLDVSASSQKVTRVKLKVSSASCTAEGREKSGQKWIGNSNNNGNNNNNNPLWHRMGRGSKPLA